MIAGLDLVVTVDTAVAHIAGSLGVPTLVIVPTVPDWRYAWPAGRTSPFYPSQSVVRRRRGDDLQVIANVRVLMERYVAAIARTVAA